MPLSRHEIAPGEVRVDPLVAVGPWLNPFELRNVNNPGFAFALADCVESIAVLGPLEANTLYFFTLNSRAKGTGDLFANHAQQSGVFVALVNAIARRLVDQGAKPLSIRPAWRGFHGRGLSQWPVHGCTHLCFWRPFSLCVVVVAQKMVANYVLWAVAPREQVYSIVRVVRPS